MTRDDHIVEAVRLLRLADTIGMLLCAEPISQEREHGVPTALPGVFLPVFDFGRKDVARLDAARDAALRTADVHASLAAVLTERPPMELQVGPVSGDAVAARAARARAARTPKGAGQ